MPSRPDHHRADDSLQQNLQRMAMLGTLAAGLGHDLRNLVMPVLLRLDALASSPEVTHAVRSDLARIRDSVSHLQRLAASLRLLAADPLDHRDQGQCTDLVVWWEAMRALVQDALPPRTTLVAEFPEALPTVAVPAGTLAQVTINLIMNARRALRDSPHPTVTVRARAAGNGVTLQVSDNGAGMDAETRQRCFEPFFTTQPRELATGMGLATSRALLTRLGGDLTLEAADGPGATFTLHLPLRRPRGNAGPAPRTVRVLATDPRQFAIVRLVIANHGLQEVGAGVPADIVICTPDTLQQDLVMARMRNPGMPPRVIVLGVPPAHGVPSGIEWVDPGQIARLADVVS